MDNEPVGAYLTVTVAGSRLSQRSVDKAVMSNASPLFDVASLLAAYYALAACVLP